jgi:signal peptidase I
VTDATDDAIDIDEPGTVVTTDDVGPDDDDRDVLAAADAKEHARVRSLVEWVAVIVGALVVALVVKTFLFQAFYIPSASMRDTLVQGDRVLVTKLAPGPLDVHRGDAVVFKDPGGWLPPPFEEDSSALRERVTSVLTYVGLLPQDSGEHLIKRIIGLPGDHVVADGAGGPVTVNGEPITEPYLRTSSIPSEVAFDVVVPEGSVWVMGDNRQNSQDSRYHLGDPGGGSVPIDNVVGVAFVTVWPADRLTLLRNPGATFADVPPAE